MEGLNMFNDIKDNPSNYINIPFKELVVYNTNIHIKNNENFINIIKNYIKMNGPVGFS